MPEDFYTTTAGTLLGLFIAAVALVLSSDMGAASSTVLFPVFFADLSRPFSPIACVTCATYLPLLCRFSSFSLSAQTLDGPVAQEWVDRVQYSRKFVCTGSQ